MKISKTQSENDTTKTFKTNALLNLSYKFDEFEFYRNLTKPILNFNVDSATAILSLKTSVEISNNSSFNNENHIPGYLHSILYEEYLEKSKFNPLGAALRIDSRQVQLVILHISILKSGDLLSKLNADVFIPERRIF